MRTRWLAFVVAAILLGLPATGQAAGPDVTLTTVRFTVQNVNRAGTQGCTPDGLTHTLVGTLALPAGATRDSVALYLHGSGNMDTWHFTSVSGYDYIAEMARLGHASVFVHSLGYGQSDIPPGKSVCFGSIVDMTHQVVQALRSGRYAAESRAQVPTFRRVALAGHSAGGWEAQVEALTFRDVDALVVAGFADLAYTPTIYAGIGRAAAMCLATSGHPKRPGAPSGYEHVFRTDAEFRELFVNVAPNVVAALRPTYEREPCGITDGGATLATDHLTVGSIKVPVLLLAGDREPFLPGSFDLQRAQYRGSSDVSLAMVANTGHMLWLGRTAANVRAQLHQWLSDRGF